MLTGPTVILALKIAVGAVTVLLLASLWALVAGRYRLHGRINIAFFALTVTALVAFEVVIQIIEPALFEYIRERDELLKALQIHLCFSIPAALLLPFMLFTGLKHRRKVHIAVGCLFLLLWTGTFVTGIFFLPATE